MKRGEITLLWVANLWTLLWLLPGTVKLDQRLRFILPVWIICGLVWGTIYQWPSKPKTKTLARETSWWFSGTWVDMAAWVIIVAGIFIMGGYPLWEIM